MCLRASGERVKQLSEMTRYCIKCIIPSINFPDKAFPALSSLSSPMVFSLGSLINYVLTAFCRIPLLISPSKGTNHTSRVKEAREAKEVREVREATKEATTIVSLCRIIPHRR